MIDIQWEQGFAVGHERIDHEHQVFLDLIKNASLADEEDAPKERILRLLEEVRKYADFHFFSEENIMLDTGYPDYDAHRQEHRRLLAHLDDQVFRYHAGVSPLSALVEFLFEWFALHTTRTDKRFAQFLGCSS